jgi:hypothetical protein
MYSEGASVQQCAQACNADETCVAFDHGPDGYCYGYKQDPLASYVGQGDEDWQCYTHLSIPATCSSIYQDAVDHFASFRWNYVPAYQQLESDNNSLTVDITSLTAQNVSL